MELNNKIYRVQTSWNISHGNFDSTISTKFIQEGANFEKDDVDSIVAVEKALLLESLDDVTENDLNLTILPIHSIAHTTLVSDCSKIEIFTNKTKEYLKTVYGELIDEVEDIKTYRFDINFPLDVNNFSIKFITKNNALWIYGIQVAIQRNTKTAADFLKKSINFENVEQRLKDSNSVLTERAENCKKFMQTHKAQQLPQIPNDLTGLLADFNLQSKDRGEPNGAMSVASADLEKTLKTYIDEKFILINALVDHKFSDFENRLNKKLDHIILLLEKENKNIDNNKSN